MKIFLTSDLHLDHYLGSNTTVGAIKKMMARHLLQADVLCIAGDISDSSDTFAKTIDAMADMYSYVVFCAGNHDYSVHKALSNETSNEKLDRALNKIKAKNAIFMDGTVLNLDGVKFGGTFGGYDFSYSYKHFELTEPEMLNHWKSWYDGRYWNFPNESPLDIFKKEFAKLEYCVENGVQVMLTHTGPLAFNIRPNHHNYQTGYFYFDGVDLLDRMPPGSIWHHGHTHDAKFLDLGNVKIACNPYGYPGEVGPGMIEKEKFLFEI